MRCPDKRQFETRAEAEQLRHPTAHVYRCRECGKWHLSSGISGRIGKIKGLMLPPDMEDWRRRKMNKLAKRHGKKSNDDQT